MPKVRCPICNTPLAGDHDPEARAAEAPFRPFCSKRCQLVDLSKWLDGDYRVPGPPVGDGGVIGDDESEG